MRSPRGSTGPSEWSEGGGVEQERQDKGWGLMWSLCMLRRFGAEKGKPAGPDRATTTVGEDMQFKVSAGNQKVSLSAVDKLFLDL